jgi:hypothetical protein
MSYAVNMFNLIILYGYCLLPTQFVCNTLDTRKVESRVHMADRCATRKMSSGAENQVFQALQSERLDVCS